MEEYLKQIKMYKNAEWDSFILPWMLSETDRHIQ